MSDFVEYWSSYQLLFDGASPYHAATMAAFQREHFGLVSPMMMWNPPWLVLWLAPILVLPYAISKVAWCSVSVVLLVFSCITFGSAYWSRWVSGSSLGRKSLIITLLASFPPMIAALQVGQLAPFLIFGAALVYRGMMLGSGARLAVGVGLLSLKPHLCALVLGITFFELMRRRDLRLALWFVGTGISQVALSELLFPGSVVAWLEALQWKGNALTVGPGSWVSASPLSVLRAMHYLGNDDAGSFFAATAAWLAFLIVSLFVFSRSKYRYEEMFSFWAAISVLIAPLAWFFDFTLFLPLYIEILLLGILASKYWKRWAIVLTVLQVGTYLFSQSSVRSHTSYFWYPLALILLWSFAVFGKNQGRQSVSQHEAI